MGIRIIGTGRCIPENILTNDDLEKMVDTSDEWIVTRTGIKVRHIADKDQTSSDMAAVAAKNALDNAGITADMIDLIVVSTVTPDYAFPSVSALVQKKIGARKCPCFDIEAACSGFLYALNTAYGMMASPLAYKRVLVIGAEKMTSLVNWEDRSTCVLFGDGAGAAVLTPGDNIKSIKLSAMTATDKLWQMRTLQPTPYITKEETEAPLQMKGQEVFKFAVTAASRDITRALEESSMSAEDIDYYLLHQANIRIINSIQNYLKQPADKFPTNVESHGNSSSASCPILIDECNRKGMFRKGDKIAVSAFGAGFVSGAVVFEW